MEQEKLELPVDKAEREQREKALKAKSGEVSETISDDSPLDENQRQKILATEVIVRKTLAVFGLDYDQLIAMDNNSLYAQAVQTNPAILDAVLGAEDPVIEAVKIAVGFKPVAEFKAKYGDNPESIKEAMRSEILAEMKENKNMPAKEVPGSFGAEGTRDLQKTTTSSSLQEIFKNR